MSAPSHQKELARLNRIIGQLQGVKRMIEGSEYCPDILNQAQAARSAIRSLELSILEKHLECCVRETFQSKKSKDVEQKVQELLELYKRL